MSPIFESELAVSNCKRLPHFVTLTVHVHFSTVFGDFVDTKFVDKVCFIGHN